MTISTPRLMAVGGSLAAFTVMVKVCPGLVSTPPLAVPPSSCTCTSKVDEPCTLAAVVKERSPLVLTTGPVAKRVGLETLDTMYCWTFWDDSSVGPGVKAAQPATVCGPASSPTAGGSEALKEGASLTQVMVMFTVAVFESARAVRAR